MAREALRTLSELVAAVRGHWITASVMALVIIAIGVAYVFVRAPRYEATVTMYVSAQVSDNPNLAYQGGLLSQERVKSYVELAVGQRVRGQVIGDLGLPYSTDELSSHLRASSALDSVLIDVTADDTSPERAAAIVNDVGTVFPRIVSELERPATGGPPPVVVRVVQPAIVPVDYTSLGPVPVMILFVLVGIAVGMATAVLLEIADNSVRSTDELAGATDLPVMGEFSDVKSPQRAELNDGSRTQTIRAEQFRLMRTNLQFSRIDTSHKVLAITSPNAGEGKTTTVLNLAGSLKAAGARVIVVDADLRRPQIADSLGLEGVVGLTNVIIGQIGLDRAIQHRRGDFDVLTSGRVPPNPSELLSSDQAVSVLQSLRQTYDYVLLDTAPVLPVADTSALASNLDGIVLVCRYKFTSKKSVRASVDRLRNVSASLVGAVLSMGPTPARGYDTYTQYAPQREGLDASGVVGEPTYMGGHRRVGPSPGSEGSGPNASGS